MTITKVHYSVLISLGDYNNERLGFTKDVSPDDNIEAVIEDLRNLAKSCGLPKLRELYDKYYEAKSQLIEIQQKLQKKTAEWNAMAEFLRTQGIKADAVNMPQFTNLLSPSVEDESSGVFELDVDDVQF